MLGNSWADRTYGLGNYREDTAMTVLKLDSRGDVAGEACSRADQASFPKMEIIGEAQDEAA